ncbi:MAG: hypothetical protein ABSB19_13565 [Methylomonas sp.]
MTNTINLPLNGSDSITSGTTSGILNTTSYTVNEDTNGDTINFAANTQANIYNNKGGNDTITGGAGVNTYDVTISGGTGTDNITNLGVNSGDVLKETDTGATVNATLAGNWTAASTTVIDGTANLTVAGYAWSVPTTGDAQNGLAISVDAPSNIVGINSAGAIAGNFEYSAGVSPGISGLNDGNYYGFAGTNLVTADQTGAGVSAGIYTPTSASYDFNAQQNAVAAINDNGYYIFNPNTGGAGAESYIGNDTANPTGGVLFNDANTYAGGDTNTLDSGGHIDAGSSVALGLDSSGTSYGVVVGTATATYGTPESNNGGQVGVLYNNTGATLDGIATGTYGDFNYGGQSAASANAGNQTDTVFTGVDEYKGGVTADTGDVFVTGYWYNPANNQSTDGLIFNATTNTWTDVNDPNAQNGTYVTGLNSQGEAVGYYLDGTGVAHGFTYNYITDTFINSSIDYPGADALGGTVSGGSGTFLYGVNDSGTLVGSASTTNYANGFGIEAAASGNNINLGAGPNINLAKATGSGTVNVTDNQGGNTITTNTIATLKDVITLGASNDTVVGFANSHDSITGTGINNVLEISGTNALASAAAGAIADIQTIQVAGTSTSVNLSTQSQGYTVNVDGKTETITGDAAGNTYNINGAGDIVKNLGANSGDILNVASGDSVTATLAGSWAATGADSNSGAATLFTAGNSVSLANAAGSSGYTLTDAVGGATLTGSAHVDTFNINAGTDAVNFGNISEVLTVAKGATANVNLDTTGFIATSATDNKGAANLTLGGSASGAVVNLAAVKAGNGFNVTDLGSNDILTGTTGLADTIAGGANDTIIAGSGNETFYGGVNDSISGGAGKDTFNGVSGDTLTAGSGADTFNIASGAETVNGFGGNSADILNVASGATANATLTGSWTATATNTIINGVANLTTSNYNWSVPTIGDAQNGKASSVDAPSGFVGINSAGTIAGNFEYSASVSPSISGLNDGNYYGFAGANLVTADQSGSGVSSGLFTSTNNSYDFNGQQNAVTAINDNGYYIFNPFNGGAGAVSYVGNDTTNPAGGLLFNDANTNAGGDANTLDSGGYILAGTSNALGLDSSNGSYGVVVGTANAYYGTAENNNGQVGVLYNNTGATLDGIANGAYGDFNYGGQSASSANASYETDTVFTGVAEHGGDVYVTGYWYNPANNQNNDGLIFNATTNTWTDVNDPNAVNGTYVTGLNSQGEAVGYYVDGNGIDHGFTYNYLTNTFINASIDYPGSNSGNGTILTGVNNSGAVVGSASTANYVNGFGVEAAAVASNINLSKATGTGTVNVTENQGGDTITTSASLTLTDNIALGASNDTVVGFANSADSITGGSGTGNVLEVGAGTSLAAADISGIQIVTATASGAINLSGQTQNLTINAGGAAETVYGTNGSDTINAGAGADKIYTGTGGGANQDVINGGTGADTVSVAAGATTINGGAGADTVSVASGATATINAGKGADTVTVTGGAATFTGDSASTAADTFTVSGGAANVMEAGTGAATYTVSGIGTVDVGNFGNKSTDNFAVGTTASASGTLNATVVSAWTAAAADKVYGTATLTTENSHALNVAAVTGAGTLNIIVGDTGSTGSTITNSTSTALATDITLGANNDTVVGFSNSHDSITGGSGTNNVLEISGANAALAAAASGAIAGIQTIQSAAAGTTINLSNQTEGFTINADSASDTITGGGGANTYNVTSTGAHITGGGGVNTYNVDSTTAVINNLGVNSGDVLNVGSGDSVTATLAANWTATASDSNAGTATITDNGGYSLNLSSATGSGTWNVTDTDTTSTATLTASATGTDNFSVKSTAGDTLVFGASEFNSTTGYQDSVAGLTSASTGAQIEYSGGSALSTLANGIYYDGALKVAFGASTYGSTGNGDVTFTAGTGAPAPTTVLGAEADILAVFNAHGGAVAGEYAAFTLGGSEYLYIVGATGETSVSAADTAIKLVGLSTAVELNLAGHLALV